LDALDRHVHGFRVAAISSLRPARRLSGLALAACALPLIAAEAPPQDGARQGTSHTSAAAAQPEPEPKATVSGVTVTARRAIPRVDSTFPAQGSKVAPGILVLRVTFTERMHEDGWSYVPSAKGLYPDCAKTPRLLDDHKTFVLICRTMPSKTYAVWFNQPPLVDFSGGGHSAIPYELVFTTADADPIRTLADAIKADKTLTSASNPAEPLGSPALGQPHETPE
jgi:hypothetical protein